MEEAPTATTQFSKRSQRSWKQELKVREDIARARRLLHEFELHLNRLNETRKGMEDHFLSGKPFNSPMCGPLLNDITSDEGKCRAARERIKALEKDAAEIAETARQAEGERQEKSGEIAQLATERLKKDESINLALDGLAALLRERDELSRQIWDRAKVIELSADLDLNRNRDLEAAISDRPLVACHAWLERFLGRNETGKRYAVKDKVLIVDETLAHSGVYFEGDTVTLSNNEAAGLTDTFEPAPCDHKESIRIPGRIELVHDAEEVAAS